MTTLASGTIGSYASYVLESSTVGSVVAVIICNQDSVVTIRRRYLTDADSGVNLAQATNEIVAANDALIADDSAPRLGSPTYYDITVVAGGVPHTLSVTVELDFPPGPVESIPIVISDPIKPGLVAVATWLAGTTPKVMSGRGALFEVVGRSEPVAINGVRTAPARSLSVVTHTINQASALRNVFETGRVLLVRLPEEADPGRSLFYIQAKDVSEGYVLPDVRRPERIWTIPFAQVAEPSVRQMTKLGNSWQQLKDGNATWQDLLDRDISWLTAFLDPNSV